jgi:hypothetical protein
MDLSFSIMVSKRNEDYMLIGLLSGIDEQLVWKSGISIPEAPNHYVTTYN